MGFHVLSKQRPQLSRLLAEREHLVGAGASERLSSWRKAGHDYSELTIKGYLADFFHALEEALGTGFSNRIGLKIQSDQETETHKWLGFFPQMREWIENRQSRGMPIYAQKITNKLYEATVDIDVVDWKFDKSGEISMKLGEAGVRAAQHWELLANTLLEANPTSYDGQTLFSANHTLGGDSPTMKNDLTAADYPELNVATTTDPQTDEMAKIIVACTQQLFTFKDSFNEPLNGGTSKVLVIVPNNMHGAAVAAVRVNRLNFGQDSPLQFQNLSYDVVVNPRATKNDTIYIAREDGQVRPLILQEAIAPEVEFQGPGSYPAFMRHAYLFGINAMRAVGPGEWSRILRCTLS